MGMNYKTMNIILEEGIEYRVPNNVVELTPYLRTLRDTEVPKEVQDDAYIVNNVTLREMEIYCRFMYDSDIRRANIPTLIHVSDFLGNKLPIDHGYPIDYYVALIKDWWIENVGHKLIKVQYKHVQSNYVKFLNDVLGSELYYIVGGYALSLYNNAPETYSDVDVYLKNKDDLNTILSHCDNNNIHYRIHKHVVNIMLTSTSAPLQIILSEYTNISDVVSSFDVDCCCIMYHDEWLYMNNRARRSVKHNIICFVPEYYSSCYSSRLIKYSNRYGYTIYIPGFKGISNIGKVCKDLLDINGFIDEEYDDNDKLLIYTSFKIPQDTSILYKTRYSSYASEDQILSQPSWDEDINGKYRIPLNNMQQFFNLTTLVE